MKNTTKIIGIKKAIKEHHALGNMIAAAAMDKNVTMRREGLKRAMKAMKEHHALGKIIGDAAKAIGKGVNMSLPYIGVGGKFLGALGGGSRAGNIAGALGNLAQSSLDLKQINQARSTAAAQEKLLKAQARGAENQNTYLERQMAGLQPQKKGGRTKSYRKNCK
jgi:hypothetical protein